MTQNTPDRTTVASALVLLALAACQPLPKDQDPPAAPELAPRYDAVTAALEAGDLDAAHAALDALQLKDALAAAQATLADGDPRDALVHVDTALELAPPGTPDEARALELKARGATAVADRMIVEGAGAVYIEGALFDALAAWRRLDGTPANRTSASEVAFRLGDFELARDLGRQAAEAVPEDDVELAERASRAWAEAAFLHYVTGVQAGDLSGDELNERYFHAEEALLGTVGFAPDELHLRERVVDLYLWAQAWEQARSAARTALERLPGERALLDRYLTAGAGYADLAGLDPAVPLHRFYTGRERLRAAIAVQRDTPEAAQALARDAAGELREAEEALRTDGAEELAGEVLGWRVIARTTQGWCAYWNGELARAEGLFTSVEKLMEGGAEWRIEGEVRSAVDGLFFIGDQHRQAGAWEAAARVFGVLEELQPNDVNWANNAGFFARDAAVELEAEGRDMCALASGELADDRRADEVRALAEIDADATEDAARELLIHAANQRFARARALAESSYASYVHAAALAPDDVRIVNDTALIQVYYLHADLTAAEGYLERAIELGAAQLAEAADGTRELSDDELFALTEAYGDAHQNMGVLRLMHEGDLEGALPHLEASRDIGPIPRPLITGALIPFATGELDVPLAAVLPEVEWCAPCALPR